MTPPPPLPTHPFDAVIIGAGAVGLATALALSDPSLGSGGGLRVCILEAEDAPARHQTGHNSGVIHSGLYYKPGSLKARLCTEGRDFLYAFCQQRNIPHERCGKVVVATTESELPALAELQRRGHANNLHNLRRLTPEELRDLEPHAAGIAALHVPETGIVNYATVAAAYADALRERGGEIHFHSPARRILSHPDAITVETPRGRVQARQLINCAGLHSDRVAKLCGLHPQVQIVPFRGEYYTLTPHAQRYVRNLIYPVPNPAFPFLGVHFTRMIPARDAPPGSGGGVEAGPNAVLALSRHGYSWSRLSPRDLAETALFPGFWRMAAKYWRDGLGEMHRSFSKRAFVKALQRLIPELRAEDLAPGGSGVRAQAMEPSGALVDDFRIQRSDDGRMVHILNAPSPAATASLAIGRHIAAIVRGRDPAPIATASAP